VRLLRGDPEKHNARADKKVSWGPLGVIELTILKIGDPKKAGEKTFTNENAVAQMFDSILATVKPVVVTPNIAGVLKLWAKNLCGLCRFPLTLFVSVIQ
jgi:hypothetical protein